MKFTTADEAFDYIGSFMNFERSKKQTIRDYRLDRMKLLLEHFENPQNSFKMIHIAGSKGKGSTGVLTASALDALGLKTGLYTSPHISNYRERITRAGEFFTEAVYIKAVEEIAYKIRSFTIDDKTGSSEATTFELLTLMAFLIFKNTGCSWAVIETGIGGRLDATNVILPEAVIITPIEKEHTDILGSTLEKIAMEKAGIIKKNIPVFTGYQNETVLNILNEKAREFKAPIHSLEKTFSHIRSVQTLAGNEVKLTLLNGREINLQLKLLGKVQSENAAIAWMCLEYLLGIIPDLTDTDFNSEEKILEGLNRATLPGRFEITRTDPVFIFDGAHTPESIKRVIESYKDIFSTPGILIFGSVAGKDSAGMAELLTPYFNSIIISTPGTFKESNPKEIYETFKKFREDVLLYKVPEEALSEAIYLSGTETITETEDYDKIKHLPILVTGSFYMAGEIRKLVVQENNKR